MTNEEKTAIQNEQQSIDEIIKIIANKKLTIEEANKILYGVSKKINQQIVKSV